MPRTHVVGSGHTVHIMFRNTLPNARAAASITHDTHDTHDTLGVLDRWALAFAQGAEGVRFD